MEQEVTGAGIESLTVVVWLLLAVMVVAVSSKYLRVPYPVALVIAGLVIAFTPLSVTVDLTPELILFIFLPALLFEASYNLNFPELRDNLRPIVLLAIPGVILTAACVAGAMHFTAGISWQSAFLFGAIMAATDPVSVLAIFRRLGAPHRLSVLLEGESLFNDGTAIVIFRIVLATVIAGQVGSVVLTIGEFLVVVLGALALGLAVGFLVSLALSRVNDYLVETAMTLVVAYGTYLLAERVGVSGVISVVVAALVVGNYGRSTAMSPSTRVAVSSTWEFIGFIANSLIFLLIGLELNVDKLSQFWLPSAVAILVVLVVRAVVVVASGAVLRYTHRPIPFPWQIVLVWGGLRGAVSLALALSLPATVGAGRPFPDRDLLQVMTFVVILFSLLVQGMTMEPLLKRLGLRASHELKEEFEVIGVRKGITAAALAEVESMSKTGALSRTDAEELRKAYAEQIADLDEELQSLNLRDEDIRQEHWRSVRRHLLQIQKGVVSQRQLDGEISQAASRRLLAELDEQIHALDDAPEVVAASDPQAAPAAGESGNTVADDKS